MILKFNIERINELILERQLSLEQKEEKEMTKEYT